MKTSLFSSSKKISSAVARRAVVLVTAGRVSVVAVSTAGSPSVDEPVVNWDD